MVLDLLLGPLLWKSLTLVVSSNMGGKFSRWRSGSRHRTSHQSVLKTTATMSFHAPPLFVLINLPGSQMHSGYRCELGIRPSWDEHRLNRIVDLSLTFHVPFIQVSTDWLSLPSTYISLEGWNVRGSGTVWKFLSARRHSSKPRIMAGSSLSHTSDYCRELWKAEVSGSSLNSGSFTSETPPLLRLGIWSRTRTEVDNHLEQLLTIRPAPRSFSSFSNISQISMPLARPRGMKFIQNEWMCTAY